MFVFVVKILGSVTESTPKSSLVIVHIHVFPSGYFILGAETLSPLPPSLSFAYRCLCCDLLFPPCIVPAS